MKLDAMDDDITSGLLAGVTMTMVTLAAEHGQMALFRVMTDVTVRMVSLAVQHGQIATHHMHDNANQVDTGHIEELNLSTVWTALFLTN